MESTACCDPTIPACLTGLLQTVIHFSGDLYDN